tara:strand:- start:2414 stop:2533 length:120 start_codon:yes stop_codon:yes gene_type:complete
VSKKQINPKLDFEQLIEKANQYLYSAKQEGKDRFVLAKP